MYKADLLLVEEGTIPSIKSSLFFSSPLSFSLLYASRFQSIRPTLAFVWNRRPQRVCQPHSFIISFHLNLAASTLTTLR